MRSLAPLLFPLAMLALGPQPALAQLKARVVSANDPSQGVASKILMLKGGVQTTVGQTLADGRGTLSVASCEATMAFRASPLQPWAWSGNQSDWKTCAGDTVDLKLSPSDGFASLMDAYSFAPADFGDNTRLAGWQAALQTAGAAGDTARVAYLSNEIAYSLGQSGEQQQASKYSALAIAAGTVALTELGLSTEGQVLVFAPDQGAYVATPETLEVLAAFKKQQGLGGKDTAWDGATFRRINALTAKALPARLSTNEP